jgi:uncharacterized SAM-binding protein YcdF (DUF218 family)
MAPEDPLEKADAIFVFAGNRIERPREAATLFREGYAPVIVITRATIDLSIERLRSQGVNVATEFELTKALLRQLDVPDAALITPTFSHDSTGEEARTLRELAARHRWRRVIVVSSKYHLRRVGLACRRALRGTGVEVLTRGTRYDQATPDHWWKQRSDIRWLASEMPKLVAYALGVAG